MYSIHSIIQVNIDHIWIFRYIQLSIVIGKFINRWSKQNIPEQYNSIYSVQNNILRTMRMQKKSLLGSVLSSAVCFYMSIYLFISTLIIYSIYNQYILNIYSSLDIYIKKKRERREFI